MKIRLLLSVASILCFAGCAQAQTAPVPLLDAYIARDEPDYKWAPAPEGKYPEGNNETNLVVTSQRWQGTEWKHRVQIFAPEEHDDTPILKDAAVIWIGMGDGSPQETLLAQSVARATGALGVNVFNVPNQPLFGKSEDALIAHTFAKYMETKDATWPLLFPMTKSVIRAMDAVSDWSDQNRGTPIERFVIMGASKRGWTTYLTAESDNRVVGIVPMVYNFLNIKAQLDFQKKAWGGISDQITDYKELLDSNDPGTQAALRQVDPYTFVKRLKMPKFLVLATNDRYWTAESFQFYEKDLPRGTSMFLVPNASHDLKNAYVPAMLSAGAWIRRLLTNDYLPQLKLKADLVQDEYRITATAFATNEVPRGAKLWFTMTTGPDRRDAKWIAQPMEPLGNGKFGVAIPASPDQITAAFAEMELGDARLPLKISTPVWLSTP